MLPVFIGTNLLGQEHATFLPAVNFGFCHSVYTSMCFEPYTAGALHADHHFRNNHSGITETQYGFGIGIFLWMPLNAGLVYKPKVEGNFSTACLRQASSVFATSFDLGISNSFAIALKPADAHGVIYLARQMSCYLTSKQPYLLIGPKLNLKKFDAGFIDKGFQNELSFGILIGYGINYEFHGTNFVPEISYSITSTAQNKINDSKKVMHSISLAISFF